MTTFKDLLRASRSYRSFDETITISEEQLTDWIAHTRYCPSSVNLQMLKYRIVTDRTECATVLANTRWAGKLKHITLPPPGHAPTAYIVICSDDNVIANAASFQKDVGICAQTILLAACESGYGGCMLGSFQPDLKELLALPAALTPQLVLALGRPAETVQITDEAPDGSVTYYRNNGIHYVQKRSVEHLIVKGEP